MYKRFIKRGLDIFLSTLGIIILAPFLLLICIFIMIDSKGPIIFTQKRVGKDSTHFNIYKFRTMKVDTPKEIPTHLLDNPNFFITNSTFAAQNRQVHLNIIGQTRKPLL